MNDDKIKPLPCPFCGMPPKYIKDEEDPSGDSVRCSNVECVLCSEGPFYVWAWNRRPIAQEVREEEKKKWCAMCGKWGNHQSGTCPEIVREEEKDIDEQFLLTRLMRKYGLLEKVKLTEDQIAKACDESRERVSKMTQHERDRLESHARRVIKISELQSQLSALTKELDIANQECKRWAKMSIDYDEKVEALTKERDELRRVVEDAKKELGELLSIGYGYNNLQRLMDAHKILCTPLQSAQSMERNKEGV
jgi:hypothetical protein